MNMKGRLLACIILLCSISAWANALQITFPVEVGSPDSSPKTIVLKARSLKDLFNRFEIRYGGDFYRYGIYGDRSRAFRPDKTYNTNQLGTLISSRTRKGLDYEIKMTLRTVTDPTLSYRDDLHFTDFYATVSRDKIWNLRAGDLYPSFSRYTLNRFVKGVRAQYFRPFENMRLDLRSVIGRTQRAREMATLRRVAIGTSATLESLELYKNRRKWFAGYRFASASDQLGSVDNALSLADLQIDVHSVEYGYQLPFNWTEGDISLGGENAWSRGSTDRKTVRDRGGYSWKNDLAWVRRSNKPYAGIARMAPFAVLFNWELNDPYFQAPLGIASQDQMRINLKTAHRFNSDIDWTFGYLRLENNVRNQIATTNTTQISNAAINMRPFMLFGDKGWTERLPDSVKKIRTKLEFRYSDRDASNGGVNQKIEDYLYSVQYANWGINFSGDYQFQITDDDISANSDRRLQVYGIRATRPLFWEKYNMRFFPRLGYNVSRDRYRIAGTSSRLQTTTLGMGANWEELGGMINYLILDADRAPAGNDYLQNKVNLSVTYKPYLYPGFQSTLSYGYLDLNDEAPNRSYRQTETRFTMNYTF